jgi:hypothetical protein
VRTIEAFRNPANENSVSAAFTNGYTDGQTARNRTASLSAYLRVGIDDYARGYRAGFYARGKAAIAERPPTVGRQVVNL